MTIEIKQRITHRPGIHKDEDWDLIMLNEYVIDDTLDTVLQVSSTRLAAAWVTPEFMRDAVAPLETAGRILADDA